ncbi:DUF1203 domain-containing protein [Caulobacter mirabilis]|uniref:DUF1203 domain-containing protein n=1 Tax=Caulobacter mirabilis TaxID=69666 RepID=A0A2D2AWY7_9CAUL|nr:DUF1203 domain-containing protein [Caulobacter mirabilis]ATQ42491.1 hypothetical protein CSW64_08715 [Caulobacter mirabilis]
MSFVVAGLSPEPFAHLFHADEAALAAAGAIRYRADAKPGFPCRVTLDDAEPGETVLLLNHEHQSADTPYRARHAIFVREGATVPARFEGVLPPALAARLLAIRAFDAQDMMIDAEIVEGAAAVPLIERLLAAPNTAYLHAHYARRGCFAARIDRR